MERERDGGGEPDPPEVSGNERLDERGGGEKRTFFCWLFFSVSLKAWRALLSCVRISPVF